MRRTSALLATALLASASAAHAQYTAYGLVNSGTAGQQLVSFNTANPAALVTLGATGQSLTGIDFRPATGQLFGFNGSTLFTLNTMTGAATQLGMGIGSTVAGNVGFDFNPTVDRIRLTGGASGTNLRLNPLTGGLAATDSAYRYPVGDLSAGATPNFAAVAYTNSDNDAATGTTLYGIDATLGRLVLVGSPNGGPVTTVGTGLGIANPGTITGFDIVLVGTSNFAFLTTGGGAAASSLYSVDLAAGTAQFLGAVGSSVGGFNVQGLAIAAVPEPGTWALMAAGLAGVAGVARRRRSA